jgi:thiamine-monophosphate kinase
MAGGEPSGEFGLIGWIRERSRVGGQVALGIGDDCAALRVRPGAEMLVTTDMLMDGRHFRLGEASAAEVGYKALAVNLSDIAAMAGRPIAAFVAVALPRANAVGLAKGLHDGMSPLAEAFGVTLAGGDTNAWDGPLVVSVTVLGETSERGAVRRSGARPGDSILVTGPLGGSLRGRHLRPLPRVAEALAMASAVPIRSMIDLSDGLSSDLGHILEESGGLGATLIGGSIPIHQDARAASTVDGCDPLDHALNDGEDFELCLTLADSDAERLIADPPPGLSLFRVGTIEEEPGLRLRLADGRVIPLSAGGFDHLALPGR